MVDTARRKNSERDLQPVAITTVDPASRTATGMSRSRTTIHINCAYATGDTITVPAVGEQWYVERFDMEWRLYGRIPFNDATLHIEPEEGQVSVGSASGPLELNGTEVRANAPVFRLNDVYFRDSGESLERSIDNINWEQISAQAAGILQIVSNAIAGQPSAASIQDLLAKLNAADLAAIDALSGFLAGWNTDGTHSLLSQLTKALTGNWGGLSDITTWATGLTSLWDGLCNNTPFLNSLKSLGTGSTPAAQIASGLQAFLNDLYKLLVCNFNGNATPQNFKDLLTGLQAVLSDNWIVKGLGDLANNPTGGLLTNVFAGLNNLGDNWFIQGLAEISSTFEDGVSNRLTDAVTGLEELFQNIFSALFCDATGTLTVADVKDRLTDFFDTLKPANNPLIQALKTYAEAQGHTLGSTLEKVVQGISEFTTEIVNAIFCTTTTINFSDLSATITSIFAAIRNSPLVVGVTALFDATGDATLSTLERAVRGFFGFYDQVVAALSCLFPVNARTPLQIVSAIQTMVSAITNNPYVKMFQSVATTTSTNLILQLVSGVTGVLDWFIAIFKKLFPFIDWDKLKTLDFAGLMNDMVTFNITNLSQLGTWVTDGVVAPIKNAITGTLDSTLTGSLAALNTFFGNVSGGFLHNIVNAMTGNSLNFASGPLGTLATLFNGVSLTGGKSLLTQLGDRINEFGDTLGIDSIVASITGADVGDLTNSFYLEIKGSPTGGNYTLSYGSSNTTGSIAHNASAATIQAALAALTGIGAVTVTSVTSATSTKFSIAIPNTTAYLTLGAFTLSGGTAPSITVTQKFRGGLNALSSFFTNFNVFDGVNTLLQQVLQQAGSNIIPLVSALTGLSEAKLTELFGTSPITAVTKIFDNLRSLFTFTPPGGTATMTLLPAGGTFGPTEIIAAANALIGNLLSKATAGIIPAAVIDNLSISKILVGADSLVKALTGSTASGTQAITDIGNFFTNIRKFLGIGTGTGLVSFLTDPATFSIPAVIDNFINYIISQATATFSPARITGLITGLTGSGTAAAADIAKFFDNLRTTLGLSSSVLLPAGGTFDATAQGVAKRALHDVVKNINDGLADALKWAKQDVVNLKATFDSVAQALLGGTGTYTDLTAVKTFFATLNGQTGGDLLAKVLKYLTDQILGAGNTAITTLTNFFSGFNTTGSSVTGSLANQLAIKIGGSGATNLASLENFFSNIRKFLGLDALTTAGISLFGGTLTDANLLTFVNTFIDNVLTKTGSNLIKVLTGQTITDTIGTGLTTLQTFFTNLRSLFGSVNFLLPSGTGAGGFNVAANLQSLANNFINNVLSVATSGTIPAAVMSSLGVDKITGLVAALTGQSTTNSADAITKFFSGFTTGTGAFDPVTGANSLVNQLSKSITGKTANATLSDITNFLGIGTNNLAAFTGSNSLIYQLAQKIGGSAATDLAALGNFFTNVRSFFGLNVAGAPNFFVSTGFSLATAAEHFITNVLKASGVGTTLVTLASGVNQLADTLIPNLDIGKITAGANSLVKALTGSSSTGSTAQTELDRFFTNFRTLFGGTNWLLQAAGTGGTAFNVANVANAFITNTLSQATTAITNLIPAHAFANFDVSKINNLVKALTGQTITDAVTAGSDLEKIKNFFGGFTGFDGTANTLVQQITKAFTGKTAGVLADISTFLGIGTANGGLLDFSGANTASLVNQIVGKITGSGSTLAHLDTLFGNLRNVLGLTGLDLHTAALTGNPLSAVQTAFFNAVKALNLNVGGNAWITQDNLKTWLGGSATLTQIGNLFSNIKAFFAGVSGVTGGGFDLLGTPITALTLPNAIDGFIKGILNQASPGAIAKTVLGKIDISGITSLANYLTGTSGAVSDSEVQRYFTNLRHTLGLPDLLPSDGSIFDAANPSTALKTARNAIYGIVKAINLDSAISGTQEFITKTGLTSWLGAASLVEIGNFFTNLGKIFKIVDFKIDPATFNLGAAGQRFITDVLNAATGGLINQSRIAGAVGTLADDLAARLKSLDLNTWLTTDATAASDATHKLFTNLRKALGLDTTVLSSGLLSGTALTNVQKLIHGVVSDVNALLGISDSKKLATQAVADTKAGLTAVINAITGSGGTSTDLALISKFLGLPVSGFSTSGIAAFDGTANTTLISQILKPMTGTINLADLGTFFTNIKSVFGPVDWLSSGFGSNLTNIVGGFATRLLNGSQLMPLLNNYTIKLAPYTNVGTYTLSYGGQTTGAIAWNAPATGTDSVQAKLGALSIINGIGNVTATGDAATGYTVAINSLHGTLAVASKSLSSTVSGKTPDVTVTRSLDVNYIPQLGVSFIEDLMDWKDNLVVGPIVKTIVGTGTGILSSLGIDVTKLADQNYTLGLLGEWASGVYGKGSTIPANSIVGKISDALLSVIPVSNISNVSPNLISQGDFAISSNIAADSDWSWDDSANYSGTNSGSAKLTISSAKLRELFSRQAIPVAADDRLNISAYVKASNLTGSAIYQVVAPTSGTFVLTYNGQPTSSLNYNAPATGTNSVQAALGALTSIGGIANVTVTLTAGVYTITVKNYASTITSSSAACGGTYTVSLTGSPVGSYVLSYGGKNTVSIASTATAAEIDTALAALDTVGGTANVNVTGSAAAGYTVMITNSTSTLSVYSTAFTAGTSPLVTITDNFRPVTLSVVPFQNKTQLSTIAVATSAPGSAWSQIATPETYLVPTGVTAMIVRLSVSAAVTGGSVWWDDISFTKGGLMAQNLVDSLVSVWQGMWDTVFPDGLGLEKTWNDVKDILSNVFGTATEGVSKGIAGIGIGSTITDAINQAFNPSAAAGALPDILKPKFDAHVRYGRGNVRSGSNLLPDPYGEVTAFWSPQSAAVVQSTAQKVSGTNSLLMTSAGATAKSFSWTITDTGEIQPIASRVGETFYAECFVYAPVGRGTIALTGTATNSITGATAPITPTGTSVASLTFSAATAGSWQKIYGYYVIPTGYDQFTPGTTLAANATTTGDLFYVDNMLVRENTQTQAAIDGIHQAINGGTATGNSAGSVFSNLGKLNLNLFGQSTTGTVLKPGALPDISASMSADLQTTIDNIMTGIGGGNAVNYTPAAVKGLLGGLKDNVDTTSKTVQTVQNAVAALLSSAQTLASSGTNLSDDFERTSATSLGLLWKITSTTGTGGPLCTADGHSAAITPGSGTGNYYAQVVNTKPMGSDYHSTRVVFGTGLTSWQTTTTTTTTTWWGKVTTTTTTTNGTTYGENWLIIRSDLAGSNYVYARLTKTTTEIGECVNGVKTPLTLFSNGASIGGTSGSGLVNAGGMAELSADPTGVRLFRLKINGATVYTATGSASLLSANNRYVGFAMQATGTPSNGQMVPASLSYFGAADISIPTALGTGAYVYASGGEGAVSDTIGYLTPNMTFNSVTGYLTVPVSGWYSVSYLAPVVTGIAMTGSTPSDPTTGTLSGGPYVDYPPTVTTASIAATQTTYYKAGDRLKCTGAITIALLNTADGNKTQTVSSPTFAWSNVSLAYTFTGTATGPFTSMGGLGYTVSAGVVSSGTTTTGGSYASGGISTTACGSSDQYAQITYSSAPPALATTNPYPNSSGPVIRSTATGTTFVTVVGYSNSTRLMLRNGGAWTTISANSSLTWAAGNTIKLAVSGSTYSVYKNGTLVWTYIDDAGAMSAAATGMYTGFTMGFYRLGTTNYAPPTITGSWYGADQFPVTAGTWLSLHKTNPFGSNNEASIVSYARQQTTRTGTNGINGTTVTFNNAGVYPWIGLWDAQTGGNLIAAIPSSISVDSAGPIIIENPIFP